MCLFPVNAEPQEFGRPKLDPEGTIKLPCGKCTECKAKRATDWSVRCKHELSCHDENTFITLTYSEDNLPSKLIVKDLFQKFMKNLRKKLKRKVKYIVSHEYGGKTGRPHHHAIIFGWNPSQQDFLQMAPSGEPLFTSPELHKLWTHGYHSIGTANEKTSYYIASYSLKSSSHTVVDSDGEFRDLTDTMDCSKRTAIGYEYLLNNVDDLVEYSTIFPRYYKKVIETARDRVISSIDRSLPVDERLQYIAKHSDRLLLTLESNFQVRERGAHERLAKYVNSEQKKYQAKDGYRTAPESKDSAFYTKHLKQERDEYTTFTNNKEMN